jgi:dipeptidyl aminopeptidase/acylaminoacyl peptidase
MAMATQIVPQMWLSGRELSEPQLSPDGEEVAYVVAWGGRTAIAVSPVGREAAERLVTSLPEPRPGRGFGGGCFDWMPDGSGLIYAGRDGGLWKIPRVGGAPTLVYAGDPALPAQCPVASPDGTRVALVIDLAQIAVVSIADGSVAHVPVTAEFVADPAWSSAGDSLVWQQWSPPAMAWDSSSVGQWMLGASAVVDRVAPADRSVQQPRLDDTGALWSVRDDNGWLNVFVDDQVLVAERHEHAGPTWGLGQRSYVVSPDGSQVAICRNEGGFGRLIVVDRDGRHVRELGRGVHGQLDWRGSTITALRSGGRTPTQIVAYNVETAQRRVLAVGPVAGFDDTNLVEPELVSWPADDGVEIHGRLYRAAGSDGRLICWVHGGPTDQWQVTFLPRFAYWLQRGWSILVPDHRGSTGHGRAYQQAMRERWGELDTSDTAAGVRAAHLHGWGVVERTVAMGSSAGGLTVLNLCRHHGELIAAAVVLYPVSDLAALDATTHRFEAHYNATLIGTGDVIAERYRQRSPRFHPHEIQTPLLVFHGTDDPVVPIEQSRELVAALWDGGVEVDYVEYPGEGHGFRNQANQLDEVRRTVEFLDRWVPVPAHHNS